MKRCFTSGLLPGGAKHFFDVLEGGATHILSNLEGGATKNLNTHLAKQRWVLEDRKRFIQTKCYVNIIKKSP